MKQYLRLAAAATGAVAALTGCGGVGRPVDLAALTPAEWRDDLHYLAKQLARRHANAFHRISRTQYDALVARLDSGIPRLRGFDVAVTLAELPAAVGDAHTFLTLPAGQHFYPFGVFVFGEDFRVVRTAPADSLILGTRLVKIGNVGIADVVGRLNRILTQGENPWFYRAHYPSFLSREVLHGLGIVGDSAGTEFTFARDDGATIVVRLTADTAEPSRWVRPYTVAPLYVQHLNDDLWDTTLAPSGTVYVAFNSYRGLGANAARLFDDIDAHPLARLVIDLRGNGGGDYVVGHQRLIEPILRRPALNRRDRLFVITGRFTFSAAMNNAAQFRTETHATLVGEPPGEMPNSYQERRSFRLPHSRLNVNYSVRYYRFLPEDVPALIPDQLIKPQWDAYRAGRDPVLEWILAGGPQNGR